MARELLDVQKYPDLRQYPGGPPLRPYDAAGWTLPLQMGVEIGTAASPLTADVRASMKVLGGVPNLNAKATAYAGNVADAAPFDSVPGIGPVAADAILQARRRTRLRDLGQLYKLGMSFRGSQSLGKRTDLDPSGKGGLSHGEESER